MTFLNHYSFAIAAAIVLLVVGAWALERRTPRALAALAATAALLVGVNLVFRFGPSTVAGVAEFDAALRDGRPSLVVFHSNY